jgi:thioredoxin 1
MSNKTILIFKRTGCSPCDKMIPLIKGLNSIYSKVINTQVIDIQEHPDLAVKYNISSTPTIFITQNGRLLNTIHGFQDRAIRDAYLQLSRL